MCIMILTSRKRVSRLFNHQEVDRVPIDLGGRVSSMTKGAYIKIEDYFNIHSDNQSVSPFLTINDYDERILEKFNVDFRRIYFKGPESIIIQGNPNGTYVNEWGITIEKVGPYIQRTTHPLANASFNDLNSYRWPDPDKYRKESFVFEGRDCRYKRAGFWIPLV